MTAALLVGYPNGRCHHLVPDGGDLPLCGGRSSPQPHDWTVVARHGRYASPCYLCEWRHQQLAQRADRTRDEQLVDVVALRQAVADTIVEDLVAARSLDSLDDWWTDTQRDRLRMWHRLNRQAAHLRGEPR